MGFYFVCLIVSYYVKFVYWTSRFRYLYVGHRFDAIAKSPTKSLILILWHEHAACSLMTHGYQGIVPLVSHSKDGEFVVQVAKRIGFICARGSSSRGAKQAKDELQTLAENGTTIALTVDGPRGPRHVPKAGCIDLASKTGAPIVPLICISNRFWTLKKTWDQTKIPKPFSRVLICYGEPIAVPKNLAKSDMSIYQARATEALIGWEEQTRRSFEACWKLGLRKRDLKG